MRCRTPFPHLDDPKATRFALDAIAPEHPVVLTSWTGHGSLFNTAALRRFKVSEDEPDPPGGFFVRAAGNQTITGLAHEYAGLHRAAAASMMPDDEAQKDAATHSGRRQPHSASPRSR